MAVVGARSAARRRRRAGVLEGIMDWRRRVVAGPGAVLQCVEMRDKS